MQRKCIWEDWITVGQGKTEGGSLSRSLLGLLELCNAGLHHRPEVPDESLWSGCRMELCFIQVVDSSDSTRELKHSTLQIFSAAIVFIK